MIDKELLQSLIRMLDESSLDNLEIRRGGTRIRLSKSPVPHAAAETGAAPAAGEWATPPSADGPAASEAHAASAEASSARLVDVTSPMVGTFYRAPSPEADPYVEVDATVAAGDVLCVIEAMKLMNELECEVAGRVVEICADNAEPVDYGQLLFRVDPS